MKVEDLYRIIGADFYTGVPDSQLRALCDYLITNFGTDPKKHIIAANEGNAMAIAAGYHLSTGKIPVVYMQNSGEGNVINPLASLMNEKVYGIPCIMIIGWRGEPGVHDEPQHIYQGEVTLKLLEVMDIDYAIIDKETSVLDIENNMKDFDALLKAGKSVAFVVKKGALSCDDKAKFKNGYSMSREDAICHIVKAAGEDIIVSTTGKASRELFEIRERNDQSHDTDFLTVGSMGHSSSIALGIAINKPDRKIWCIDGDGALIMHAGAMATIGSIKPNNLIHIVINNTAHESVGGMPTVSPNMDIKSMAESVGYKNAFSVDNFDDLDEALHKVKALDELGLLEVKCQIGAREDLGRPTTTAMENKIRFMSNLI